MIKHTKKSAFTQLQTLLIVGVVSLLLFAIIAVPFYNSYKQKQAIAAFKTTYATLLQANRMYSLVSSNNMNTYDTTIPINEFAETYFTPYLTINNYCKGSQAQCWNSPQYKDLRNTKMFDKSLYSLELADKTILGFNKNRDGLMTMIVDIDGTTGVNKMGRDIFVLYFYNNENPPKICSESEYQKYNISDGIHLGGYDNCGIPHDAYDYSDLIKDNIPDGCTKKSAPNPKGLGTGAACSALLSKSSWLIDKNYPW